MERNEPREETWEEVTKNLRKTEVHRERLREQDDGDLERTGQPLCIYEPYYGAGSWGFLHKGNTLYRGLSLVSAYLHKPYKFPLTISLNAL